MQPPKYYFLRALSALGIFPNEYYTMNPFKMLEFQALNQGVRFSGNELVLDIGCGRGLQTSLLAKKSAKVIGIDIDQNEIKRAHKFLTYLPPDIHCEFLCTKLEEARFPDNYFDKVYSFSVIEHIPNYDEVLREAYRTLKPGGEMIFSTDSLETIEDRKLVERHKERFFVQKYFRENELRQLLGEVGFRDVSISPMFCSSFASRLFTDYITLPFRPRHVRPVLDYLLLRYAESRTQHSNDKGIFLIVKALKV